MTEVESITAARKRHRCNWCWELITIGESYRRYRVFMYGDADTIRMHPECYDAMCAESEEEGGWIEWIPGQPRPEATGAQR